MIGTTYLERGEPVVVKARWLSVGEARLALAAGLCERTGPRNVLIERADGTLVIRPFRGLRRPCHDEPKDAG